MSKVPKMPKIVERAFSTIYFIKNRQNALILGTLGILVHFRHLLRYFTLN
jgi:hypothetical protein